MAVHSMQHTPEQKQAIETLDRHCVVVAGPGAGKTRVLVERIINILRRSDTSSRPTSIDAIAAITFTKKAANEMKERLRRELGKLAQAATNWADRRYWTDLRRRIESAEITTIHGLCARILSSQPVEARIDPAFNILDEYLSQLLLMEAAESAVHSILESHQDAAIRLIMGYGRRRELVEAMVRLYSDVRSLGLTVADVEERTLRHLSTPADYETHSRRLEVIYESLTSIEKLTPAMQKQKEGLMAAWEEGRTWIFRPPDLAHARAFDKAVESLDVFTAHGRVKETVQALREHLERLQLCFYDVCAEEPTRLLLQALSAMDERYAQAKQARHAMDYEDLQWKVRDLLRAYPKIARRYSQRYRFLLVDEFQDTNSLQKDIVEQLALGENHASNLFIVGDAKQSVYNFRGAEVEVFDQTARELVNRGAVEIRLKENFRTVPALIRFFNALFAQIMNHDSEVDEETARALGYVPYLESVPTRQVAEIVEAVELLLQPGERERIAEDTREREAQAIAARIRAMVDGGERCVTTRKPDGTETVRAARYGDMAILFRAMSDIKIYEYALRRAGIPYRVIAGKGFYQREEIQDVLSLLTFLENCTNEIALTAALRSPLFGISDESLYWLRQESTASSGPDVDHHPLLTSLLLHRAEPHVDASQKHLLAGAAETLSRLMELRHRVPLADLLEEILRSTDDRAVQATYYDGYQRVANLSKLVELGRGFDATGPHFLTDFITHVEKFNEMESREAEAALEAGPETEQGAVQIMTIHKAKGLEFPIVILPDLNRKLQTSDRKIPFERSLGLGLQVPDLRGALHKTALHKQVIERLKQRERFEAQRLLFVAITRARDYLILSGTLAPGKTEPSRAKATTYLDWILGALSINEPLSVITAEAEGGGRAVLDWQGIPLRVTIGCPAVTATASGETPDEAPVPLVERYPEIRRGETIPMAAATEPSRAEEVGAILRRLEPAPAPEENGNPLSVHKLVAFARCPRQYYYETVLGLPPSEPAPVDEKSGDGAPPLRLNAAERGRILHHFCSLYTGAEPVAAVLDRTLEKEGFLDPATRDRLMPSLHTAAQRYASGEIHRQAERIARGDEGGIVHSDLELMYRTPALWLRGRIDKLIVNAGGEATLIDLKTDRVNGEEAAARAQEYALSMQMYALMARTALSPAKLRAQIYFIEPDAGIDLDESLLQTDAARQTVEPLFHALTEAQRTGQFPARPEAERCRRCRCASYCPEKSNDE